jgi:hypothetical protein
MYWNRTGPKCKLYIEAVANPGYFRHLSDPPPSIPPSPQLLESQLFGQQNLRKCGILVLIAILNTLSQVRNHGAKA